MKWTQCETTPVLDTDGIAFHTMCPVYRPEIRFNSIYHQFE